MPKTYPTCLYVEGSDAVVVKSAEEEQMLRAVGYMDHHELPSIKAQLAKHAEEKARAEKEKERQTREAAKTAQAAAAKAEAARKAEAAEKERKEREASEQAARMRWSELEAAITRSLGAPLERRLVKIHEHLSVIASDATRSEERAQLEKEEADITAKIAEIGKNPIKLQRIQPNA